MLEAEEAAAAAALLGFEKTFSRFKLLFVGSFEVVWFPLAICCESPSS